MPDLMFRGAAAAVGQGSQAARALRDWDLAQCCNDNQLILIGLVCGYSFVILLTWRLFILKPFKLITVFLHELGHATACVLTGGKVTGIEVQMNEGGVTRTVGGWQSVILPAGYLGSSFWGMIFVISSVDSIGVQVSAGFLLAALFICFFYADNASMRILIVFFVALVGGMWVVTVQTEFHGLEYTMLFIGVMNGLFSIYDIYDDLLARRVNSSDATKFAELTGTSSRLCGFIWGIMSVMFMTLGVYIALVLEGPQ